MSDPYVPEADSLDQQREVVDDEDVGEGTYVYPDHIPAEAPEGDVLEQSQPVYGDDDFDR